MLRHQRIGSDSSVPKNSLTWVVLRISLTSDVARPSSITGVIHPGRQLLPCGRRFKPAGWARAVYAQILPSHLRRVRRPRPARPPGLDVEVRDMRDRAIVRRHSRRVLRLPIVQKAGPGRGQERKSPMQYLDSHRGLGYRWPTTGGDSRHIEFGGDTLEALALTLSVERVCRNQGGAAPDGDHCRADVRHRCAAHSMLFDQKLVDLLLSHRRDAKHWYRSEFTMSSRAS
jgi:hypothetical protein